MKYSISKTILLITVATVLGGCATKSATFGESVKAEGDAVSSIGKNWEKGQAMVEKGNKLVRKGNEQISDGEENVADGKKMLKSGQQLIDDAEKAYAKLNVPTPSE